MRRRRWARGGKLALLVGPLALVLSGCSAHDVEKKLRFGWPTGVTEQATKMRVLWSWTGVTALAVGVVVWSLIFWCCIRYRKKNDELPRQTKYNLPVEIVYSILPFVFIAGLFYRTVAVENDVNKLSANPQVTIQVDAFKWNWQFEYKSVLQNGVEIPQVYKDATTTDANGKTVPLNLSTIGSDDEIPVLVIPKGETVQFVEHSEDVIHSFWVPEFLFKRDILPYGTTATTRDNKFEITATSEGSFVGRCAELCGTYHSQMNFEVRVVSPEDFQRYLTKLGSLPATDPTRQSESLTAMSDPTLNKPYATTTYPFNTSRTDRSASQNPGN
ncbi:MAG: cytochrome c oxidase subunit II [Jatrophihabitantaceae bacterium]